MRTWMPLDLITAVPVDVIVAAVMRTAGDADESEDSGAGALQAIRMMRLVKLLRIVRSARIFKRWQAHFGISFATVALIKFSVITIVMAHWLACLWVLCGKLGPAVPLNASAVDPHLAFGHNWIYKAGCARSAPPRPHLAHAPCNTQARAHVVSPPLHLTPPHLHLNGQR
jgi:hypothetical protein